MRHKRTLIGDETLFILIYVLKENFRKIENRVINKLGRSGQPNTAKSTNKDLINAK